MSEVEGSILAAAIRADLADALRPDTPDEQDNLGGAYQMVDRKVVEAIMKEDRVSKQCQRTPDVFNLDHGVPPDAASPVNVFSSRRDRLLELRRIFVPLYGKHVVLESGVRPGKLQWLKNRWN